MRHVLEHPQERRLPRSVLQLRQKVDRPLHQLDRFGRLAFARFRAGPRKESAWRRGHDEPRVQRNLGREVGVWELHAHSLRLGKVGFVKRNYIV
eukprot:2836979-Prymnesium_polylepis.2